MSPEFCCRKAWQEQAGLVGHRAAHDAQVIRLHERRPEVVAVRAMVRAEAEDQRWLLAQCC